MTNTLKSLIPVYQSKIQQLENTRTQLKHEFVGIDGVIDQVIDNTKSWFVFPDMQEKPQVINLWGMTGVGKTSLVLRMLELLGAKENSYRFDLGNKNSNYAINDFISELSDNSEDASIAILLDEMQHSRTIGSDGVSEIELDHNRIIWDLMDSGKITYRSWNRRIYAIDRLVTGLSGLLHMGVVIEKGQVVEGQSLFLEQFDLEEKDGFGAIPKSEYESILNLAGKELKISINLELEELLGHLDGPELIQFLNRVMKLGTRPNEKHFEKALVFVIGNIDEAYPLSGNLSADIGADEFYKLTTKITVPDVKNALKKRFRSEQIARMGNIHILYPSFSEQAYCSLIEKELKKIGDQFKNHLKVELCFEDSLKQKIFEEGVYPTQGVRPLLTTINQLVKSQLSSLVDEMIRCSAAQTVTQIKLGLSNDHLVADYQFLSKSVYRSQHKLTLHLDPLRKTKQDERQATTAVHEAGHAVCFTFLLGVLPRLIHSVSSMSKVQGFVYTDMEDFIFTPNNLTAYVASMLAGLCAEEVVFGEEHRTLGSSSDIEAATDFLMKCYKKNGFGDKPVCFATNEQDIQNVFHSVEEIEGLVMQKIMEAKNLAIETLSVHKTLLLKLADYLSQHAKMDETLYQEFLEKYGRKDWKQNEKKNFYRNKIAEGLSKQESLVELNASHPLIWSKDQNANAIQA